MSLKFYYFGTRIEYLHATDTVFIRDENFHKNGEFVVQLQDLPNALQNEILYRMQDNVHVAPDGCRTFREVFDTRRGKWSDVLVPMLVNMQAETSKVVDAALYGAEEFPDVPY